LPGREQGWAPRVGSWHRIRTAPGREGSMVARLLADGGRIGGGRVRVGSVWAAGACDLVAAVSRLAAERWHLSSSDIAATAYRHRADRSALPHHRDGRGPPMYLGFGVVLLSAFGAS